MSESCEKCGYDLAGLLHGPKLVRCPECGHVQPAIGPSVVTVPIWPRALALIAGSPLAAIAFTVISAIPLQGNPSAMAIGTLAGLAAPLVAAGWMTRKHVGHPSCRWIFAAAGVGSALGALTPIVIGWLLLTQFGPSC